MTGTIYRAGITTPSGLRFEATVYVPEDAEYDDQHELAELVGYGVQVMVHHRALQRAVPKDEQQPPPDPWATPQDP